MLVRFATSPLRRPSHSPDLTSNQQIATAFDQLASGLEVLGESSFRAASYRRVARFLRDWSEDAHAFVQRDPATARHRLRALPGIGDGATRRILEWIETGRIADHQAMLEKVPAGLFRLLEIPGLGPKAVRVLWQELGIEDVEQLRRLLDGDGDALESLPRMGRRSVEKLRRAIDFEAKTRDRLPLGLALPLAEHLIEQLRSQGAGERLSYAGSLRRGCETVGDLDFLIGSTETDFGNRLLELPQVEEVLASGPRKVSVRMRFEQRLLQADLRIVPPESWGAALLYFTGSKEHNVKLRERAHQRNLQLNEYGLYRGRFSADERPFELGERPVASAEEAAIYAALDLPWVPPELREEVVDLEDLPQSLIERDAIGAELHAHTTASDGKLSIDQLAQAARARGYHTLAITDHSSSSVLANGLDPQRLRRHIRAVRKAATRYADLQVLAGAEVDILPDGSLDYPDDVLRELDVVVASPHVSLSQDREQATRRLCAAAAHPLVHILGHPTGRIVGRRQGLRPDLGAVLRAAAAADTALEINANPRRLDLRDQHVRAALEAGCRIAVNTDVHSEAHFDFLRYGVLTARRGGLTRQRCVNALSPEDLRDWLRMS